MILLAPRRRTLPCRLIPMFPVDGDLSSDVGDHGFFPKHGPGTLSYTLPHPLGIKKKTSEGSSQPSKGRKFPLTGMEKEGE